MRFPDGLPPPDPRDGMIVPGRIRIEVRPATKADVDEYIKRLLEADWNAPDSPIQLAEDLTLADVGGAKFFDQTRLFLRLAAENKGAPLTATGNLNRAWVAQMLEKMEWPRKHMERFKGLPMKVIDEHYVKPLHIIRVVCQCGNLIRRRHKRMLVSRKALAMCEDVQAGVLYRHLFFSFFGRFSLDYLWGGPEAPLLQDCLAVTLWRLQSATRDWAPATALPREVLLTAVHDQLKPRRPEYALPDEDAYILVHRLLEPLEWFGLLESDTPADNRFGPGSHTKFRKTALFDRFFSFTWLP